MPLEGEVRLGGDGVMLGSVLATLPESTLTVTEQASDAGFALQASDCDFERLEDALLADDTVRNPRLIGDFGDLRVYRVEPAIDRELFSVAAADLGVQVLETRNQGDAWLFRMRFLDRRALSALKTYCDEQGLDFRIRRLSERSESESAPSTLSEAQRELLVTAYEMGYLEEPRACSLADVAAELGISSSAASGRLRRATAALVESEVLTQ